MPLPALTYRLVKGSPLTPGEMDGNLHILSDGFNGLEALVLVTLDQNGHILPNSIPAGSFAVGAIQTADIGDQQVTPIKIANAIAGSGLIKAAVGDPLSVNVDGITLGYNVPGANISGQLALSNQPANNDILRIIVNGQPVTFTFVTTIGVNAGNVLIGANANATVTNLLGILTNPSVTSATQVALSAPNQTLISYVAASASGTVVNLYAASPNLLSLTAVTTTTGNTWTATNTSQLIILPNSIGIAQLQLGIAIGPNLQVEEQQATNTDGGGATAHTWIIRVLNTVVKDQGVQLNPLNSNTLSLKAGTYRCEISAPAFRVGTHQIRLQNISGTPSTLLVGTSECTDSSTNTTTRSFIEGYFTLADNNQQLQIQHWVDVTKASDGLGISAAGSPTTVYERYTVASFWKVA